MPSLLNIRPLTSASTAKAGERGNLSKLFAADKFGEEIPAPALLISRGVRFYAMPVSETVKLQSATKPMHVTAEPPADVVRTRLYGDAVPTERMVPNYCSSGSEHDPSSVCLAAMVNEFMENEPSFGQCGRARCNCRHGNCSGDGCNISGSNEPDLSIGGEIYQLIQGLVLCTSVVEATILADVARILSSVTGETGTNCSDDGLNPSHAWLRRVVMKQMRRAGYNAAICKSRWGYSCGMPAGDYEYVDVLCEDTFRMSNRLVVDIDFRAQFEIARPSSGYLAVWQLLPATFVGKPERLQQIINVMSEAAKQSLKLKGLHLPPWRKPDYLKAKWLSPYKRTTNDLAHRSREGEHIVGRDFAGIAVRGSGLDAKCTNEMETLYHETGSRLLMTKCGGRQTILDGKGYGKRELSEVALRSENRGSSQSNEITVIATDWQPPAVAPRPIRKSVKVAGLASVLTQAGLTKPLHIAAKQREKMASVA